MASQGPAEGPSGWDLSQGPRAVWPLTWRGKELPRGRGSWSQNPQIQLTDPTGTRGQIPLGSEGEGRHEGDRWLGPPTFSPFSREQLPDTRP